ncbi:gluconokinase [Streptomyces sp. NPDC001388]|uniref:gluconokinase n=1 Tax=unclassified Streptomyces TaxID=2593676 RepID=UPI0036A8B5B3
MIVVVLGVSGSGKSTVGAALADALGMPFLDGDAVHPAANVAKMRAGQPLDDRDREPWLRVLADRIHAAAEAGGGLVVACSALRRRYRDVLRSAAPGVWCLHLALDRDTARRRVAARTGHFMPAELVDSQFDTLEPLTPDEPGTTLDATTPLPTTLTRARSALADFGRGGGGGGDGGGGDGGGEG